MKIIEDYPPNFDELIKVFPITKTVIFAWGDKIYNPNRIHIPAELISHEEIHGARQKPDVEGWWARYIEDPVFRIQEEIPAHQAEYKWLMENGNRHERKSALKIVSKKLSAPLYGQLIKPKQAREIIKGVLNND